MVSLLKTSSLLFECEVFEQSALASSEETAVRALGERGMLLRRGTKFGFAKPLSQRYQLERVRISNILVEL